MSRLSIDMTDQQHQSLKALAALEGKTIKEYAIERLFPKIDSEADAFQKLRAVLQQRLAETTEGAIVDRSIQEIVEQELQSGGPA